MENLYLFPHTEHSARAARTFFFFFFFGFTSSGTPRVALKVSKRSKPLLTDPRSLVLPSPPPNKEFNMCNSFVSGPLSSSFSFSPHLR